MYSGFIKFILTLTGLSPILFSYWLVTIIQKFDSLTIYIDFSSVDVILLGIKELLNNYYLLFLFIGVVLVCNSLFKTGLKNLSIGAIDLKSIKSADVNFNPILFSYILPWFKFYFKETPDLIFLLGFIFIYTVYSIIGKNSFHYNLILRLVLGYRNYEVQTKKEVSYLMLSKTKLINPNQANSYIQFSDYMIVNVTKE